LPSAQARVACRPKETFDVRAENPCPDRGEPRNRPCHGEALFRRGLAGPHLLTPAFDPRCPWPGGEENHIEIDLADPNKTIAAIETIKAKVGGRVHALVNNAGISPKGEGGARLNTMTTDLRTWGHVFHVNFFAPVILARGLKDELTATKGAIVNVTSIAGVRVHPFAGAAYATSKAALAALTREMAHDFGPLGVRVNAIAPGEVETAILSPGTDKIVEKLPLRRLGQPKEVADAIWFLCSDQSSYISGAEIEVNGAQHV